LSRLWKAAAYPRYNKRRKKLSWQLKKLLTAEEDKILANPQKGDRKRGALRNVWVEKFQAQNDQILIAYEIDEQNRQVNFMDVGQHENFYRDLEKYLK